MCYLQILSKVNILIQFSDVITQPCLNPVVFILITIMNFRWLCLIKYMCHHYRYDFCHVAAVCFISFFTNLVISSYVSYHFWAYIYLFRLGLNIIHVNKMAYCDAYITLWIGSTLAQVINGRLVHEKIIAWINVDVLSICIWKYRLWYGVDVVLL